MRGRRNAVKEMCGLGDVLLMVVERGTEEAEAEAKAKAAAMALSCYPLWILDISYMGRVEDAFCGCLIFQWLSLAHVPHFRLLFFFIFFFLFLSTTQNIKCLIEKTYGQFYNFKKYMIIS